jgi:hypothetical protein
MLNKRFITFAIRLNLGENCNILDNSIRRKTDNRRLIIVDLLIEK